MHKLTSSLSDRQLIRETTERNERAFEELYHRYSGPLYNYLLRLIHEREVAEELLQEVFVAVWKGAGRFQGRSTVKTWLFRIAHHQAVDWLRKRRPVLLDERVPLSSERNPGPEADAFRHWRAEQLQVALGHLSADHRAVVELVFYEGLSYQEVAQVVDCPVGTVKSRISYAKKYLNGVLRRMGLQKNNV